MTGPAEKQRFHALDSVRATAMLLGVVYHSMMFRMMVGGGPPGPMGMGGPSRYLQDWLHCFRMPLFFLISGFFGRMVLEKYGTGEYLRKRWVRIGLPLLVGMFTVGPAYILTREAISSGPSFGGGPPGAGSFGPGGGMSPLPPGFVPPPLARFDDDGDGSLSDTEWKKAREELDKMFGGGPPPGGPGGAARPWRPGAGFRPSATRRLPSTWAFRRDGRGIEPLRVRVGIQVLRAPPSLVSLVPLDIRHGRPVGRESAGLVVAPTLPRVGRPLRAEVDPVGFGPGRAGTHQYSRAVNGAFDVRLVARLTGRDLPCLP